MSNEHPSNLHEADESQKNTETMEICGEEVLVYDHSLETLKSEVPVMLMPGWSGSIETYRENLETITKNGRRVLMAETPHGVEDIKDFREGIGEKGSVAPDVHLKKIAAYMEVLDDKEIHEVDVISYSEGAIHTIIAASIASEKFRNLVLVNPGGLIGNDSFRRLSINFSKEIVSAVIDTLRNPALVDKAYHILKDISKTVGTGPIKSIQEITGITNTELENILKELRQNGIKISILHGADDTAFPMDKMQQTLDGEAVDGFYSVEGGHRNFLLEPKKYTEAAESALTALESKTES